MPVPEHSYIAVQLVYRYIGDEIAVNTFHVSPIGVNGDEVDYSNVDLAGLAEAIGVAWSSELNSADFSNQLHLTVVKCYGILPATGHAGDEGSWAPTDDVHGSATAALPPQVSCCVTTWGFDPTAFVPDRARRRGRMYLPGISANAVDSSGLFTTNSAAQYRQHVVDLFNAVSAYVPQNSPQIDHYQASVFSKMAGALFPVQQVSTDTLPDIQRRRVNQLTGVREFSPVNH